MKKHSKKLLLVNVFGSLGYIACLILWGWTGIVYLPIALENESITKVLLPEPAAPVEPTPANTEPSPIVAIVGVTVAIVVVLVTILVLLRAPVTIAKTGQTITTKAAASALPLITHSKPVTPVKKKRLTIHLVKLMKLLLILLPVSALVIGFFVELSLPLDVVAFASSSLGLIALFWFILQYTFAELLHADTSKLV